MAAAAQDTIGRLEKLLRLTRQSNEILDEQQRAMQMALSMLPNKGRTFWLFGEKSLYMRCEDAVDAVAETLALGAKTLPHYEAALKDNLDAYLRQESEANANLYLDFQNFDGMIAAAKELVSCADWCLENGTRYDPADDGHYFLPEFKTYTRMIGHAITQLHTIIQVYNNYIAATGTAKGPVIADERFDSKHYGDETSRAVQARTLKALAQKIILQVEKPYSDMRSRIGGLRKEALDRLGKTASLELAAKVPDLSDGSPEALKRYHLSRYMKAASPLMAEAVKDAEALMKLSQADSSALKHTKSLLLSFKTAISMNSALLPYIEEGLSRSLDDYLMQKDPEFPSLIADAKQARQLRDYVGPLEADTAKSLIGGESGIRDAVYSDLRSRIEQFNRLVTAYDAFVNGDTSSRLPKIKIQDYSVSSSWESTQASRSLQIRRANECCNLLIGKMKGALDDIMPRIDHARELAIAGYSISSGAQAAKTNQ